MSTRQLRLRVKHLVLRAQACRPGSRKHAVRVARARRWAILLAKGYVRDALQGESMADLRQVVSA